MAAYISSILRFSYLKSNTLLFFRFRRRLPRPRFETPPITPEDFNESLAERLQKLNAPKDPEVAARVNIGLPYSLPSRKQGRERLETKKKNQNDSKLAYQAFTRTLRISLEDVKKEWSKGLGPYHIQQAADHYGIYTDLFRHGYFIPSVYLDIFYDYNGELANPVHRGNLIPPSEATSAPEVSFESLPTDLWSLVLTNPDGHLLDDEAEYLHWFIGNIKGNNISTGEVICDYLQPFPPRGTGYHRYVFVLYKQDKMIDYSSLKKTLPCFSLKERTFKTFDFYKEHQDVLTPAGLSFFQSSWDETLTDFFQNTLKMHEPVYQYRQPKQYFAPQVKYPCRKPFNLYLDKYRDPKEIREEVVLKRLRSINPFEEEPPLPKYPNIYDYPPHTPSWRKSEIWKERNRIGKYRDLRPFYDLSTEEFKHFSD